MCYGWSTILSYSFYKIANSKVNSTSKKILCFKVELAFNNFLKTKKKERNENKSKFHNKKKVRPFATDRNMKAKRFPLRRSPKPQIWNPRDLNKQIKPD